MLDALVLCEDSFVLVVVIGGRVGCFKGRCGMLEDRNTMMDATILIILHL